MKKMNIFKFAFIGLFLIALCSCHKEKTSSVPSGLIDLKGFILTSEQIDNGYFNNKLFYFFPSDKLDSNYQGLEFINSLDSIGYGFSLYSSYYVRLINCMGMDLISYTIDNVKTDPYKLKIEYWKILPVKLCLEYNTKLKNVSDILSDSILIEDGSYIDYKYKYIGKVKIKSLEILLPKGDDLTGNEAIIPMRRFGIFGKEK
jgi:hypothetical protein